MSPRTTFRLPGYTKNTHDEHKCILSLLTAYSRQWNPRNIEYPWYDPWSQILAALVADLPSYTVYPQPYLWYDSSPGSQPYTTPGPDCLMSNEHNEEEALLDVGNVSLSSIMSISVPSHRDRARIPDFGITRKVSFPRSDKTSLFSRLSRGVAYVGYPLLAELKACGPRTDDIKQSLLNAVKPMRLARKQLVTQAFHLFKMYPHQESVILLGITGFWWSYAICGRGEVGPTEDVGYDEGDGEQPEDLDPSFGEPSGIHGLMKEEVPSLEEASNPEEELTKEFRKLLYAYGSTLDNHQMSAEVQFQSVLPEGKVKLVENGDWSDYLLYGTAQSNQVFSLIHDRLDDIARHFKRGERG